MTRKISSMLFAAFLLGVFSVPPAFARINGGTTATTNTQPDQWCNGGTNQGTGNTATELCQDWNGNWIPTTNNKQTSGSASLQWKDVETANLNSGGGAVTVGGAQTLGTAGTQPALAGTGVAGAASSVLGLFVTGPATQVGTGNLQNYGINVSTIIPVNSSFETLISSGNSITLTGTPTISTTTITVPNGTAAIPDGTWLVLQTTQTISIIFQSNGQLSGSLLKLGAAQRVVSQFKTLGLQYSAVDGFWEERFYTSNGN